MIAEWKPIKEYNRTYCPLVVVLDWFTYVADDQTKALHPVRYVASLNGETGAWVDDDGQELDIDPTHFYPLPSLPLPAIYNPPRPPQRAPIMARLDANHRTCPTCGGTGTVPLVFGEVLTRLRKEAGQSQEMVAQVIGLSRPQVTNLEAGRSQPAPVTLIAIANHFGVSVDYLLGRAALEASDHG